MDIEEGYPKRELQERWALGGVLVGDMDEIRDMGGYDWKVVMRRKLILAKLWAEKTLEFGGVSTRHGTTSAIWSRCMEGLIKNRK